MPTSFRFSNTPGFSCAGLLIVSSFDYAVCSTVPNGSMIAVSRIAAKDPQGGIT
jgi:hypothetical protein